MRSERRQAQLTQRGGRGHAAWRKARFENNAAKSISAFPDRCDYVAVRIFGGVEDLFADRLLFLLLATRSLAYVAGSLG